MKHPTPNPTGTSAPHWQAAGDARLVRPDARLALRDARLALPYCESCRRFHWPARARCPQCRGQSTWRDASGLGRIATFSIVRRAVNPELAEDAPYAIAFVDLDEGVRLFTNIVDAQPDMLKIGMRVRCKFEAALDATVQVPVFALEADFYSSSSSPSPPAPPLQGAHRHAGRCRSAGADRLEELRRRLDDQCPGGWRRLALRSIPTSGAPRPVSSRRYGPRIPGLTPEGEGSPADSR
ncbi:MAG: hypothetical protein GEV05_27255 [Betaproteobacteria bacterium]|nr:hypothetical protein [Betaproteobacteria bacterium]